MSTTIIIIDCFWFRLEWLANENKLSIGPKDQLNLQPNRFSPWLGANEH